MSNTYFSNYMPDRYWAKTYPYWPSTGSGVGDIVSFVTFICRVATMEAQLVRTLAKRTFVTWLMRAKVER